MPAGEAGAASGGDEAAPEESPLPAVPPGSRPAKRTKQTRTYEKSSYNPVKNDRRKDNGPRTRSYAGHRNAEKSSATIRNIIPGAEVSKIPSIAKGIYEQEPSIYNLREQSEEDKLFVVNESIRDLLEGLKDKNKSMEKKNEEKA